MNMAKAVLGFFIGVVVTLAAGTVIVRAQDADKNKGGKEKSAATKEAREQARAEHLAALKKAFDGSKTSLSQAIASAETASNGKAFQAEMDLGKDGKLGIQVVTFAGDKIMIASVDPATGKSTVKEHKEGDHHEGDDDDDDDDHEHHH
jgi:hypothetical protein